MDLSLGINSRKCHTIFFKTLEIKRIFQEVLQNAVFSISFYARSFLTNFSGISSMSISAFSNISSKKINKRFDAPLHKMFSLKDFVRKCDQIRSLRRFGHIYWRNPVTFTDETLMENFIFCPNAWLNWFRNNVPLYFNVLAFSWRTGFYMIGTSTMKDLSVHLFITYAKLFNKLILLNLWNAHVSAKFLRKPFLYKEPPGDCF